ncbi:MAG: hypothetical protein EBT03_07915 [Betaproteobacteria bacterium]|nr:hypothetical protein [Betaproteobacteria bacterium]NCA16971.1 hypothetical protein [Betaproteobacteria bacterium]
MEGTIRQVLESLTIGKGGVSSSKRIGPDLLLRFHENTRNASEAGFPYALSLGLQTVNLRRDDVFTKSKGRWSRDCVWRLTPEACARFAEQVAKVLETKGGAE